MYEISKLKNGLTLITVDLPHLDSVTTFLAVGAGSRYENKQNNGISHFLEHMFFKGSKKYPSAEIISSEVDGMGAVNNASTSEEITLFWVKSSTAKLEKSSDILSSMLKEPLLDEGEIEKEKGVIVEEIRMYQDRPAEYVFVLFMKLFFGDQPLGWSIAGEEKIVTKFNKADFTKYTSDFYQPKNMVLVYAGKLPKDIKNLAEKYFGDIKNQKIEGKFIPAKSVKQNKPKINIYYKKTDQANIVLGVKGFGRSDKNRYAAKVLGTILGEGMSSRLFMEIREKRGLAYHVMAGHETFLDTGIFLVYAGLKLEKLEEGIKVIKNELMKATEEKVWNDELKKAKEMIRGRLAIRAESTNFLAEYFGCEYILDKEIESFEEYLKKIDAVTAEDILKVAKELFKPENFNLQIIAPLKSTALFEKILLK